MIRGFERLLTLVADAKPFRVRTPFLWATKTEVVERIVKHGCGPLIGMSRSCAETIHRSNQQPHCGVRSQCIDRRVGIIAATSGQFDPVDGYAVDVFIESLPKDVDKIMAASYVQRALEVEKFRTVADFVGEFPEVCRALRYVDGSAASNAERALKLYKRHAGEVEAALDAMQLLHAKAIRRRTLPPDCLLRIMMDSGPVEVLPVDGAAQPQVNGSAVAAEDKMVSLGRVKYLPGFNHILVDDEPYDLRERHQARLCLQYLIESEAFDADSARHFTKEIDPYVRSHGNYPRSADPKIDHYFNDPEGKLPALRKALIQKSGRRDGRYFLKVK